MSKKRTEPAKLSGRKRTAAGAVELTEQQLRRVEGGLLPAAPSRYVEKIEIAVEKVERVLK